MKNEMHRTLTKFVILPDSSTLYALLRSVNNVEKVSSIVILNLPEMSEIHQKVVRISLVIPPGFMQTVLL